MPRIFHRVGSWVFAVAIGWYLAGNYLIHDFEQQGLALADALHTPSQDFDIGTRGEVVIHSEGEGGNAGTVKIDFDPDASQATVDNENLRVKVHGQLVGDVLHITLSGFDRRYHGMPSPLNIVLPSSVKKLGFSGSGGFEVSGRFATPTSALSLESLGCDSNLRIKMLVVNQLSLTSICLVQTENYCCDAHFELDEDVAIHKLVAFMTGGSLEFRGDAIAQVLLNVSEDVKVTGRRAFLAAALFNKLSTDAGIVPGS